MAQLKRNIKLFSFLLVLAGMILPGSSLFAEGSAAIKFGAGYYPNMLHQAENPLFFNLREVNRRLYRKQASLKEYYGSNVVIKNIETGGDALHGIPMDIGFRYYWRSFFFSLGFVYISALTDQKSYTVNTRPGVDTAGGKTENFYNDYSRNNDADLENDINLAKGLIRTNGEDVTYRMFTTGRTIEIPFVLGVSVFANESSNFYIGLGSTYIYGEFARSIQNFGPDGKPWNGDNNKPDIDRFSGAGLGFQFLFGAEKKINRRFGYVVEVALNFGAVLPLQDEVKSTGATLTSLFHSNREEDLGGSEEIGSLTRPGFPKLSGLLFTGYRVSFGMTYYVAYDSNYGNELEFLKKKKRTRKSGVTTSATGEKKLKLESSKE